MKITKVENLYYHALCVYLRTVIFVQGQNVPIDIEIEHNEDHAIPFYESLGFIVDGDGFMEAGILHHMMVMKL